MSETARQMGSLGKEIVELANRAMGKLVNPEVNHEISVKIPEMMRQVDEWMGQGANKGGHGRACLQAGLWVLADDLHQAHEICQAIPNNFGSAWHAVVHRRDGDFWNSKYWWRRAGSARGLVKWEGVVRRMGEPGVAAELLPCFMAGTYDPAAFVDLVEEHYRDCSKELAVAMVEIQRAEWMALFEQCVKAAREERQRVMGRESGG